MKKLVLTCLMGLAAFGLFAQNNLRSVGFGEEGEAILYYTDEKLYFLLPYVGEYAELNRSMLAVDKDGFLKFKYKDKSLLIIDGQEITQYFTKFQNDGENKYTESKDGFYSYNIKSISASSSFSEVIKGQKIEYTPDNLYKCFDVGCKCHPYWWNDAHIPWVEGAKGYGIGETITVEYKKPRPAVSILNGYVDINNMKLYKENARLKEIEIEDLQTGKKQTVHFEDKVYFNYIAFEEETAKIKITIKDVYPGTKYSDTCVSAIIEHQWESGGASVDYFNKTISRLKKESTETVLDDYYSGRNLFTNKYQPDSAGGM